MNLLKSRASSRAYKPSRLPRGAAYVRGHAAKSPRRTSQNREGVRPSRGCAWERTSAKSNAALRLRRRARGVRRHSHYDHIQDAPRRTTPHDYRILRTRVRVTHLLRAASPARNESNERAGTPRRIPRPINPSDDTVRILFSWLTKTPSLRRRWTTSGKPGSVSGRLRASCAHRV